MTRDNDERRLQGPHDPSQVYLYSGQYTGDPDDKNYKSIELYVRYSLSHDDLMAVDWEPG